MSSNTCIEDRTREAYENLANAIIMKAVDDYRKALNRIQKNKNDKPAEWEKESIETFFHSEMFGILTSVNPDVILDHARKTTKKSNLIHR